MSHRYDRRRGHAGWSPPLPMARTGPAQRPAGRSRGRSRGDEVRPLCPLLARTPQHLAPGLRPTLPPLRGLAAVTPPQLQELADRPSAWSPAWLGCQGLRWTSLKLTWASPALAPGTPLPTPRPNPNPTPEPQPHARTPTSRPSPNIMPEPQHHTRTPTPRLSPRPHDSSDCKAYSAFFCSANISKNYSRNKF